MFPSRPSVCASAEPSRVFLLGITQERHLKPLGLDLTQEGGGALAPVWSYRDALALTSSHPRTVTQAPLRS
jgi:hypothetical protein